MAGLRRLRAQLLQDGRISESEVQLIRDYIHADGELDLQDVKLLVELLSEASEVCPEFDELFFPTLKRVVLQDGQIGQDEQYMLLKMLYADGHVRDSEREFLRELRQEITESTPQFDALCEIAFEAHPTNWDLGGR